jgi:hypothetical protein
MCRSFTESISVPDTCPDAVGVTVMSEPERDMHRKFYAYKTMLRVLKLVTSSIAALLFHKAHQSWFDLLPSFNLALIGWLLVYTAPLVGCSFCC